MSNPYYEDELYDQEDFCPGCKEGLLIEGLCPFCDGAMERGRYFGEGRSETSYHARLFKGANGHLAVHEGWLTRYPGEDWGEASGWDDQTLRLNELDPEYKKHAIRVGRSLKPGESVDFYPQYMEEDDEGSAA